MSDDTKNALKERLLPNSTEVKPGSSMENEAAAPAPACNGASTSATSTPSPAEPVAPPAAPAPAPAAEPATVAAPAPSAPASGGLFDSLFSTMTDLSKQATVAVGDLGNAVVNLGTHATKLSTTNAAETERWREHFPMGTGESDEDEALRCFFFCNLLTSIGAIPGTLYVTSSKFYFLSDSEIEYNLEDDDVDESHYRVSIPFNCISGFAPKINPRNDVDRYIEVVTADDYDFWFTGFINYDSAFANLLSALHDTGRHTYSLIRNAE